ncbi:MAG TPA: M20/M25/M40 family metallo-hydrolase [Kofleriaceae bacterium]|nr:M20/M25/M40 family metallo-hydrolase [Kofleriaceae bacterium]
MKRHLLLVIVAACCPPEAAKPKITTVTPPAPDTKELAAPGETHLKNVRQLTFGGDNAEAYWSFSGDRLIFQTNHQPHKCDQIEVMPSTGGPAKLVSTGKGRTTCSYFLKGDQEIIYASTHEVSAECPTPPDMSKGYLWGLFDYDIYKAAPDGSNLRKLAPAPGYDAEATVCGKDGSIVFTSMRSGDLELWRMDADGGNLRQLTNLPGYDGGAFFSADCSKLVWRSSRPQGNDLDAYKQLLAQNLVKPTKMDIWVANGDGTEAHQVTYLPGASFAPFFFPDGKRILFSSNFKNPRGPEFDIYAIDIDGTHLEQITNAPGFDGFPVFSPDGTKLAFSSNRQDVVGGKYRATGAPAGEHDTNVFVAEWVNSPPPTGAVETVSADRYRDAIYRLADDATEGRGIGTKGLRDAADFVQQQLAAAGAEPGYNGAWRQTFDVTTEVKRGASTALELDGKAVAPEMFAPMPFSASKTVSAAVVEAGWGIVDAETKLDDYKGKNVKGKFVLVHRFVPSVDGLGPTSSARLGDIRYKAFTARGKGAVGLIVVDDGDPKQDEAPLPSLATDGMADLVSGGADAGLPIIVLKRDAAAGLAKGNHKVKLTVALEPVRTPTDNVVGLIKAGAANKLPGVIVIGAHVDHLGMGGGSNALDPKVHAVHNGADDNASGVAALLEVAAALGTKRAELQRDVYVVAFSGEEEGDLGSAQFVRNPPTKEPVVAMLNMDMVGRMRNNQLHVNGAESAKEWHTLVDPACDAARVVCTVGGSGYGPSDHMAFYVAGIPVLFFFTGNHLDYHTATDDADKINSVGGARVAMIVTDIAMQLAKRADALTFVKAPPTTMQGDVRRVGASLGTVPSYSEDPNQPPGVILADVVPDGAAAKAGMKGGDRITQIGTVEIRNINDLMFVLQTAKPGTDVKVTFVRDGKHQTVTATYGVPRGRK